MADSRRASREHDRDDDARGVLKPPVQALPIGRQAGRRERAHDAASEPRRRHTRRP
jgi:hypothetical protein